MGLLSSVIPYSCELVALRACGRRRVLAHVAQRGDHIIPNLRDTATAALPMGHYGVLSAQLMAVAPPPAPAPRRRWRVG